MKKITLITNLKTDTISSGIVANAFKSFALLFLMVFCFNNANAQNGTFTIGNGATSINGSGVSPFTVKHRDSRVQILYLGSDLNALGASSAGWVSAIAFNIRTIATQTNTPFTVRMGIVPDTYLTNAFLAPSTFDIHATFNSSEITAAGWFTLELDTPFWWPGGGNDNILIEICKSHTTYAGTNYVLWGTTHPATPGNEFVVGRHNSSNGSASPDGCVMTSVTPTTGITNATSSPPTQRIRPNIKFIFKCNPADMDSGQTVDVYPGNHNCLGDIVTLGVTGATNGSDISYQWQIAIIDPSEEPVDEDDFVDIVDANNETYEAIQRSIPVHYRRITTCTNGGGASVNSAALKIGGIGKYYDGTSWIPSAPNVGEGAEIFGDFDVTGDMSLCGLIIAEDADVTIAAGQTMTVGNRVIVLGAGQLTFEDSAALIQTNPTAKNIGNVTYKRTTQPLLRYDFTYWSSPVAAQKLGDFSPLTLSDKFYSYSSDTQGWVVESMANEMVPGKGYMIRAPQCYAISATANTNANCGSFTTPVQGAQEWTGNFVGVPNNGEIKVEFRKGATNHNLIGNPYPSAIDATIFKNENTGNVSGTFFFWTHANGTAYNSTTGEYEYSGSDYATFVPGSGGTAAYAGGEQPDGYIAAGQSFVIKGRSTGAGMTEVTFKNTQRRSAADNAEFFRAASGAPSDNVAVANKHRVWLNLTTGNKFKQLMVGYMNGATLNYDEDYDGEIMGGTPFSFYSKIDDHQLVIQGRPMPFNQQDLVPLGFGTNVNGNHQIALDKFDGIFVNQEIYLEDTMLDVVVNLKEGAYQFTSAAGNFPNRFILRYAPTTLKSDIKEVKAAIAAGVVAFKQQSDLAIHGGGAVISKVKVFDLSGRLLSEQADVNSTEAIFNSPNWSSQVLVVQINTSDNMIVTKKVVF